MCCINAVVFVLCLIGCSFVTRWLFIRTVRIWKCKKKRKKNTRCTLKSTKKGAVMLTLVICAMKIAHVLLCIRTTQIHAQTIIISLALHLFSIQLALLFSTPLQLDVITILLSHYKFNQMITSSVLTVSIELKSTHTLTYSPFKILSRQMHNKFMYLLCKRD